MFTQPKTKADGENLTSHVIPLPCRATHRDAAVAAVKPVMAAKRAFLFPAACRLHLLRCMQAVRTAPCQGPAVLRQAACT